MTFSVSKKIDSLENFSSTRSMITAQRFSKGWNSCVGAVPCTWLSYPCGWFSPNVSETKKKEKKIWKCVCRWLFLSCCSKALFINTGQSLQLNFVFDCHLVPSFFVNNLLIIFFSQDENRFWWKKQFFYFFPFLFKK